MTSPFVPLHGYVEYAPPECWTVRAAGSAPSGANQQSWHFVAVSDPTVKQRIRAAAEAEERVFYERIARCSARRLIGAQAFVRHSKWLRSCLAIGTPSEGGSTVLYGHK